ncbi:hypothetical protein KUV80_11125 [Fictibacillus nanhaiensis]|uniref:OmpL47-type beta-barrel domain-containing protein n=1 Tax=Fictibacillus nanhaiensis TaxID=742169 RepID=UPI001C93DF6D|nr:hypothetical protein [Fictibacillus nanhaiensis]MBY6037211.1 hypothetical protein [Fictibacillus nanhaiensis]
MKINKLLLTGVLSSLILIPTTAFASTDSTPPSAATSASKPSNSTVDQQPSFKIRGLNTTSLEVNGNITPITTPTSEYTSSTSKIDLSNLTNYEFYDSITDGKQTVSFSSTMDKRIVPNGWYADWAPHVESNTPDVLFSLNNELTLNLSQPATTFGFELSPNLYGTFSMNVDYYSGSTLVGSLKQNVTTSYPGSFTGDIKVFGAKTMGAPFDRVTIRPVNTNTWGFAIAQIRYSTDQTAPETFATMSMVKNNFKISLAATDDISGVAKTEYRINGGDWIQYQDVITINNSQQLQFRSIDVSGNVEDIHTIGMVKDGFRLENAYVKSTKGIIGPLNKTLTSGKEFVDLFLLGISN